MNELRIGQRIRVTEYRLETGVPARDAKTVVSSVTEGIVTGLRNKENSLRVTYTDGHQAREIYLIVSAWAGPILNRHGGPLVEIIEQPPKQCGLFERRAA